MDLKINSLIICLSFSITLNGTCQESQLLSKPGLDPEVNGVLVKPEAPGAHPAVIILYGSNGWRPEYVTIARNLAESGFTALVLDYYAETGGNTDMTNAETAWPHWQASVRSSVTFLMEDPSVKKGSVGLLGYSLGGFLAVSTASSIPEVKGVVEYFGGAIDEQSLESQVRDFPPLLILHGEKDEVVPVSKAYELRDAVLAQGGKVEMKIYPGAAHGYNAPWIPYYNDSLANDSFQRTIDFFRRNL
jgi:carboxymethylenebutenolidase